MKKTLAFIFGTRPEIIKLSPAIRYCVAKNIPFFTVHTGQHYSYSMSDLFFDELGLPEPDYYLDVRSSAPYRQGEHTGKMMAKLEDILLKRMPSAVLVQGDTNSVLAGALTVSKISTTRSFTGFDIKLCHVEAGLRSYDRSMPEEINRVVADHLSDLLFAPTANAAAIAVREGIEKKKIHVTGNTIVDAVRYMTRRSGDPYGILKKYGLARNGYILLTLHRQENVDNEKRVRGMLKGVELSAKHLAMPVIFPIHPRTVKVFKKFKIEIPASVNAVEPCGFVEFLDLERHAGLILTDSGGVQEEACVMRVPCVTLRDSTERPETVSVGANIIAGVDPDDIFRAARKMARAKRNWKNPFGDGKAGERIIKIVMKGRG